MRGFRFLRLLAALAIACFACSCQTRQFHKKWESELQRSANPAGGLVEASHDLAGAWEGEWKSGFNGHTGKLRCLVSGGPKSANLDFHYYARWGKLFAADFKLTAPVAPHGLKKWKISGEKNLGGNWGGRFTHTAEATRREIHSDYHALGDHGEFHLRRASP